MRCMSPRTVGFLADGKTITWSQKKFSKEYPTFQLPCSKCRFCKLEYARQWAVRCIHESQMHEESCFITLTYSEENLVSDKLIYKHFQDFMKRLREKNPLNEISYFVTGEYGEKTNRPHWHAIIFGYKPKDAQHISNNGRGDKRYISEELNTSWKHGKTELGDVTFESAGYCARYAFKKLSSIQQIDPSYKPISKKSSKRAIGSKWLEQYWPDVFNYGKLILPNGETCGIPRYYEKWLQKNQPSAWRKWVTETKPSLIKNVEEKVQAIEKQWQKTNQKRDYRKGYTLKNLEIQRILLDKKLKQLKTQL